MSTGLSDAEPGGAPPFSPAPALPPVVPTPPARPLSPVAPAPPAHDDGLAPFFADRGRLASGAAERLATRPRPVSWLERARQGLPLRRTVLIADDEPTLRLLVTATIASGEIDVLQAADGDQAWELIERHQPDLVLLDMHMPGRSGVDLTRSIRAHPQLAATPVVILTSRSQATEVASGLEAGADLYLTKPFSPLSLLTFVEHTLGLG